MESPIVDWLIRSLTPVTQHNGLGTSGISVKMLNAPFQILNCPLTGWEILSGRVPKG